MSDERRAILDLLADGPGLTPKEIAEELDRPSGNIRFLLFKLANDGAVVKEDGRYHLAAIQPSPPTMPLSDHE